MPASQLKADALELGELNDFIGFHIRLAQLRAFEYFRAHDAMLGLSPALFSVMLLIESNRAVKQVLIAALLQVDRSTVARMIDQLEALSLVRRRPSIRDRRTAAPHLTSQGRRLVIDALSRTHGAEDVVFAKLTKVERAMLLELLQKANDLV